VTGRASDKIRISPATNESLKQVIKRAPQFSASALADTLLTECLSAITTKEAPFGLLPTIGLLRNKLHGPPMPVFTSISQATLESRVAAIEKILASQDSSSLLRIAESPTAKIPVTAATRPVRYGKEKREA